MKKQKKSISTDTLCAFLDYLSTKIEGDQDAEALNQILELAEMFLLQPPTQNTVTGLDNIRVEMNFSTMAQSHNENTCAVQVIVPSSLSNSFKDLSCRMCHLQDQDPETFTNASNALNWLANGK